MSQRLVGLGPNLLQRVQLDEISYARVVCTLDEHDLISNERSTDAVHRNALSRLSPWIREIFEPNFVYTFGIAPSTRISSFMRVCTSLASLAFRPSNDIICFRRPPEMTENLVTPIRDHKSRHWAIELVPTGIVDASRTPVVLPVMVTRDVDSKVNVFGFQYWHQQLVDMPGSRRLFNNNADDLIDLESDSTNGWFVSARLVAISASRLFSIHLATAYTDVLAGIDHGLAHSREIAGYRELDEDPVVFEFDVRTPTTVFSRFAGGQREAWCAIKSSFVKTVVLHDDKYDSDVWFPIGMARHVMVQCMSSKWMQACAALKRSEVLSWLPNSRGQEQRGSKSAVVALLLTQLRPDHVVGRSLPEITKYVHRYFTDFCLHRVQDEDKNEALEAAQKVSGLLRSLAHVVPAPDDDDTDDDEEASEEEEEEEEEAPLVKPAGKQPHKPLTEQEQNQLKTNLVFYSTNAHFKPKIESLVRDLSPHCIDDDDDSVEFESLNIPCMRALQKLFEDERARRTKMLKDYHRRAKAKRDKAGVEPMQVQPMTESKSVEPVVETKSIEPVIAPTAEPVVETKSVEPVVVEESKAPGPMETDEKSDECDDDEDDDSLDNVPDRTLPMRPLTPETVTCEWSTDYYSPFEGGMSDEEIKTQYGVTMPPSSPTFSAMSTTSSSTPMDAMSSSSLTPTKHALQEEDDSVSVAKRPRRFLTEVERLKFDFEQPNPTRFSKRLLRTSK